MAVLTLASASPVPAFIFDSPWKTILRIRAHVIDSSVSGTLSAGTAMFVGPAGTLLVSDPTIPGQQSFDGLITTAGSAGQTVSLATNGEVGNFSLTGVNAGTLIYVGPGGVLQTTPHPDFHLVAGVVTVKNETPPIPFLYIGSFPGRPQQSRTVRFVGPITLANVDTGGGLASLVNPFGAAFMVTRAILNTTTAATSGTFTLEAGIASTATALASNIFSGLTPAATAPAGSVTPVVWGATQYLTVSTEASTSAGLVSTLTVEGYLV